MNPFDALKDKVQEIKHDVRVDLKTELLEEAVRFDVSRLLTLRPDRAEKYQGWMRAVGD